MRSLLNASLLAAFCFVSLSSAMAGDGPSKSEAPSPPAATVVEPMAQPIVEAIQPIDQTRCRPSQPPQQPNQPAVVEPPKFDMVGADSTAGPEVPIGVSVALGVVAAIVGGGAGVAVQWKATHRAV